MIPKNPAPNKSTSYRGQAAVEFALVAPVVALLLVAASDLMRMYFTAIEVSSAAKAGVQYGAQNPGTAADLGGMQQAAKSGAANLSAMTATALIYCQCPDSWATFSCSTTNTCAEDQIGEQRLARSGVLGRSFAQAQHVFLAAEIEALEDFELYEFSTQHFDSDSHRLIPGD